MNKPIKLCTFVSPAEPGVPCFILKPVPGDPEPHHFRTSTVVSVKKQQREDGNFYVVETLNTIYEGYVKLEEACEEMYYIIKRMKLEKEAKSKE